MASGEEEIKWEKVSCLAGAAEIVVGKFVAPRSYKNETKGKHYELSTDWGFLKLDEGDRVTIKTDFLQRDVCSPPSDDVENVLFESAKLPKCDGLHLPGNGVWFFLSNKGISEQARCHYREKKWSSHGGIDYIATSPAFKSEYNYAFEFQDKKPQVRYHCSLNSLIESYKSALGVEGIQFRNYGTTRYSQEHMYTILICPSDCELDCEEFPIMSIGVTYDVITVREKDGMYFLEWRPYCSRSYGIYDVLAFIFYFPNNSKKMSFALPLPYDLQLPTGKDREYGALKEIKLQ